MTRKLANIGHLYKRFLLPYEAAVLCNRTSSADTEMARHVSRSTHQRLLLSKCKLHIFHTPLVFRSRNSVSQDTTIRVGFYIQVQPIRHRLILSCADFPLLLRYMR